jgi:hypothetical protein
LAQSWVSKSSVEVAGETLKWSQSGKQGKTG